MQQAQLSFEPPPATLAELPAPARIITAVRPPRLLASWTPFWPQFFRNVVDFVCRRDAGSSVSACPPGAFWPDVFVNRPLPLKQLGQSAAAHVAAAIVMALSGHMWLGKGAVVLEDPKSHSTITYYKTEDFLPAFSTPKPQRSSRASSRHDPTPAPQEIVSVPSDADNSEQTIANLEHPELLRQTAPLPNLVVAVPQPRFAAQAPKLTAPHLAFKAIMPRIDAAPAQPRDVFPEAVPLEAREIASDKPSLSVNGEAPEAAKLTLPTTASDQPLPAAPQANVKLAAQPQAIATDVPASASAVQLLALSARPVEAPPQINIPDGSRKGAFATSPLGRIGAAGTPGAGPAVQLLKQIASGSGTRLQGGDGAPDVAAGLPVGISISGPKGTELAQVIASPAAVVHVQRAVPPAAIVGDAPSALRGALLAAARPNIPRDRDLPANPPKPVDPVFGAKRVYSMQINLPNLASSGGSWIIRFAEMQAPSMAGELSTPVATTKVDPAYPASLQQDKVQGTVVLYAVIHEDGSVGEIRVLHSVHDRLDENAKRALARWKFRPATKSGAPVALEAVVQIPFYPARVVF